MNLKSAFIKGTQIAKQQEKSSPLDARPREAAYAFRILKEFCNDYLAPSMNISCKNNRFHCQTVNDKIEKRVFLGEQSPPYAAIELTIDSRTGAISAALNENGPLNANKSVHTNITTDQAMELAAFWAGQTTPFATEYIYEAIEKFERTQPQKRHAMAPIL